VGEDHIIPIRTQVAAVQSWEGWPGEIDGLGKPVWAFASAPESVLRHGQHRA